MIQCKDCEFFRRGEDGEISFACDPFSNVKEVECIQKWQLIKINQMVASYQSTLEYYRKLSPMQEKMLRYMEQELDDINEADKWKVPDEEEGDKQDDWNTPAQE